MRRTDDFAKLVDASDVDAAKKTVAMILVDACRPLENGGAADVGSLSRAFLAMVPLQLEQYLGASEDRIMDGLKGFVAAAVKTHADECMGNSAKAGRAAVFSVRRLAFEVAKGAGPWGVLLYLLIDYKDVIVELVMR
jgi:hypothetical protein